MGNNHIKEKLKRRGEQFYLKYFYNDDQTIDQIIKEYDEGKQIDETKCTVVFNIPISYKEKIYDLITYIMNMVKRSIYLKIIKLMVLEVILQDLQGKERKKRELNTIWM